MVSPTLSYFTGVLLFFNYTFYCISDTLICFRWHVISNCWLEDPEQRPTFTELHELFTSLLENVEFQPHGDYTYIRDYTRCIPDNYYIPSEVCALFIALVS